MKAVILAAGRGSRLGNLTARIPKCLVKIKNRPILDYQLKALLKSKIKDIVVVAGYCMDQIERYAGYRCKIIFNESYKSTNSIYSLWLARSEVYSDEFVLLNSDIVAEEDLIVDFVNYNKSCASLVDNGLRLIDLKIYINAKN